MPLPPGTAPEAGTLADAETDPEPTEPLTVVVPAGDGEAVAILYPPVVGSYTHPPVLLLVVPLVVAAFPPGVEEAAAEPEADAGALAAPREP